MADFKVTELDANTDFGSLAYWDDTAKKITTTAATNQLFGHTVPTTAANIDDDPIYCTHAPTGVIGA